MENTVKNLWNTLVAVLLVLFAVVYFVCPDLIPGPVDDVVVAIFALKHAVK